MIDRSLVDTFETDGAVAVRGLLDPEWIQLLRDAIPELLQTAYDPVKRRGYDSDVEVLANDGMWRKCEAFGRFLFGSPLGDVAAAVMRSKQARLYEDLLLYRGPAAHGAVSWHRDAPHWPLRGNQLCSIWFTLEPVGSDTGAMRFVAGSHYDPEEALDGRSVALPDPEDRRVIVLESEPCDVTVFHPRAIHTAYGSSPDRPRRSFTIRFTGDDIRYRRRSSMYHAWMATCGLQEGDPLDHPWFPVVGRAA